MKRKFWKFVHDRLEQAWHWVYYHQLAEPRPQIVAGNYEYIVSFVSSKGEKSEPESGEK